MSNVFQSTQDVLLHIEEGIATVTLNKPQSRNSLSLQTLRELHAAFTALDGDSCVRVVVLTANGPAFSAGHDLKEVYAHSGDAVFYQELFHACAETMKAIVRLPKPVIAKIRGVATAAGAQLVASADLAYAAESARFATPGVNIGLFCSTPMVALSRNVAHKHALELLLSGDLFTAQHAARIGLINRALPEDELDAAVDQLACKIAAKSSVTLAIGKEAFYRQAELPLDDAYAYAAHIMVQNLKHEDASEGICAFLEKRTPVWRN
ncbi:MAG: enoyl-CoA hydratase [Opitutales bacterium]|nr:enoyl-CoA hydratase [Opitutales bacterium]